MAYGISGGSMTAIQQTIDSLVGRYFPIESRAAYAKTVLAQLALNMALNGKASEDNATTIAAWLFHVRYRPCNVSPRSKVSEIELANQIRSDALKAGLLLQTASGIGFVSPGVPKCLLGHLLPAARLKSPFSSTFGETEIGPYLADLGRYRSYTGYPVNESSSILRETHSISGYQGTWVYW